MCTLWKIKSGINELSNKCNILKISATKLTSWLVILFFHVMAIAVYEIQLVDTNAQSSNTLDFSIDYIFRITIVYVVQRNL